MFIGKYQRIYIIRKRVTCFIIWQERRKVSSRIARNINRLSFNLINSLMLYQTFDNSKLACYKLIVLIDMYIEQI